ncbi:MAG: S41 family peptidase [bacterium]|nr:S41 family peptidase [bacterium]
MLKERQTDYLSRKQNGLRLFCFSLFLIFISGRTLAQVTTFTFPLSPLATKTLVDSLANQINKYYVIKDAALKMSSYLRKRFKDGAYNKISDPHILAGKLTTDVLSVQKDEHFHVEYNPQLANEVLGNIEDVPKMVAEKLNEERSKNFGFKKAEILNGNIGYLEISSFSRLNAYSKATANAALAFVSNARALIIDLRYGVGGSPDMVNHIVSHFFRTSTHVADIYIRCENATLPYWTVPDSSFGPLTTIPIYILTSYKTFSAAEGLAYQLQSLKRATLVGEVTRGGAHTVSYKALSSGFISDIPFGRSIDPISKKNWEGTGIVPDITVTAENALEAAELKIFENALSSAEDSVDIRKIKWQMDLMQARNHPIAVDTATLKKYVGNFGAFALTYLEGKLYYQKTGKARFPLIPMSNTMLRPKGNDTFTLELFKNESGRVVRLVTYYDDGRREYADRTP